MEVALELDSRGPLSSADSERGYGRGWGYVYIEAETGSRLLNAQKRVLPREEGAQL